MKVKSPLVVLTLIASSLATLDYCSSENTGSGEANFNTFQSNGLCSSQCSGYAFGIVQGSNCWCSNVMPGSTTSTDDCSDSCPGYPSENCGSQSEGLYGYIQLSNPSATADSETSATSSSDSSSSTSSSSTTSSSSRTSTSSSTSSSSTSSSSTSSSTTSTSTSSSTTSSSISSSTSSSTSSSASSSTSSSSSTPSSSTTSSASSSVTSSSSSPTSSSGSSSASSSTSNSQTTQSSRPTSSPSDSPTQSSAQTSTYSTESSAPTSTGSSNSFWSSPGKVAGTFVVVGIVGVASIVSMIALCLWRRRNHDADNLSYSSSQKQNAAYEKDHNRNAPSAGGETIVPVDQRLDPNQMFMMNNSRNSLADELDYSRRILKVANPDT